MKSINIFQNIPFFCCMSTQHKNTLSLLLFFAGFSPFAVKVTAINTKVSREAESHISMHVKLISCFSVTSKRSTWENVRLQGMQNICWDYS